jgi:uncharacterized protein DUF4058
MPSPFPGMDPYLEHPRWFHGFHNKLITHIEKQLQPLLPKAYYADSGQRVWLEARKRPVEPDVKVMRKSDVPRRIRDQGGVAVAEPPVRTEYESSRPVLITVKNLIGDEHIETFLEIRAMGSGEDRLVATIEVLSRSNKTPSHQGFDQYRRKQRKVLAGQAHLIEIDLLRSGTHVTAVPRDIAREKAGPYDYHVSVHRFDRPKDYLVYPIRLEQRLPVIVVPLLPEDPEVLLDLQAAFTETYDMGPYRKAIRNGEDPIKPHLRPEQAEWVKTILKAAGEGESSAAEPVHPHPTDEASGKKESS